MTGEAVQFRDGALTTNHMIIALINGKTILTVEKTVSQCGISHNCGIYVTEVTTQKKLFIVLANVLHITE